MGDFRSVDSLPMVGLHVENKTSERSPLASEAYFVGF